MKKNKRIVSLLLALVAMLSIMTPIPAKADTFMETELASGVEYTYELIGGGQNTHTYTMQNDAFVKVKVVPTRYYYKGEQKNSSFYFSFTMVAQEQKLISKDVYSNKNGLDSTLFCLPAGTQIDFVVKKGGSATSSYYYDIVVEETSFADSTVTGGESTDYDPATEIVSGQTYTCYTAGENRHTFYAPSYGKFSVTVRPLSYYYNGLKSTSSWYLPVTIVCNGNRLDSKDVQSRNISWTSGEFTVNADSEITILATKGNGYSNYWYSVELNFQEMDDPNAIKDQQITTKVSSKTYKASDLKKKSAAFMLGAKAKTNLVFSVKQSKNSKYISVDNTGKVTVKKGAPKGTYVVVIKAKASKKYREAVKHVTITVK